MRRIALLLLGLIGLWSTPIAAQTVRPIRGDVNGDGQITALDALAILSFAVGKSLPAGYVLQPNADNNGDGQVTAVDALIALSFVVGRDVSQFPINTALQTLASIELSPSAAIVLVGESTPLVATLRDSSGAAMAGRPLVWTSSNAAIATVSGTGVVTATGVGVVTITAAADGKSGSVAIAGDQLVGSTVAAGWEHSCALTTTGAARCWGSNVTGQLGDGTRIDRSTPVPVAGALVFKSITAGEYHSCAITTAGAAYCWGQGFSGQVGDGTGTDRLTPTAVSGGRTYESISAGARFTVALTPAGAAFAWGVNGDGTTTVRTAPVAITGGLAFKSVSSGANHVLAVTTGGALYGWGENASGQLGDSTLTSRTVPVRAASALLFRTVAASFARSFAIASDGAAYAWGANAQQLLGTASTDNTVLVPTPVTGGRTFKTISAGASHVLALSTAGNAFAWGDNSGGQLGTGSANVLAITPVPVDGGRAYRSVSAGQAHSLAQTLDGTVYTWGFNRFGQIGDGTTALRTSPYLINTSAPASGVTIAATPVALLYQSESGQSTVTITRKGGFTGDVYLSVESPPGVGASLSTALLTGTATTATITISTSGSTPVGTGRLIVRARPDGRIDAVSSATAVGVAGGTLGQGMVVAGAGFSCGLTTVGKAYCWGSNNKGQLGDTLATGVMVSPMPIAVRGSLTFATLSLGQGHTCGLTAAGAAYCWGDNEYGQLGNGLVSGSNSFGVPTPTAVVGGMTFRSISAGAFNTCALTAAGAAWCWGGPSGATGSPVAVAGGVVFHQVSVGPEHFVGLTKAGDVYAWGRNSNGELGDGTINSRVAPARVTGAPQSVAVVAAGTHSTVLAATGTVSTWGRGTLGLGVVDDQRMVPTVIPGLTDMLTLSGGVDGDVGLRVGRTAMFWGRYTLSDNGTIDGCFNGGPCTITYFNGLTPRQIGTDIRTISGGSNHAMALSDAGIAMGLGSNGAGEIGDGTRSVRTALAFQPQGYSVAVSTPLWLTPGGTVSTPVTVTRRGGFTITGVSFPSDISLAVGALPAGVTGTISPNPLITGQSEATLSLASTASATPGPVSVAINASAQGAPSQSVSLSAIVPSPVPATGLNLVCPIQGFFKGYECLTYMGVTAPFKWNIEPLHTPITGSVWWVETGSEVCVKWDANTGEAMARFSGGSFGGAPTVKTGRWGLAAKKNGDPDLFSPTTWLLYTSALDLQLNGLGYFTQYGTVGNTIPAGATPIANYNFTKGACPW